MVQRWATKIVPEVRELSNRERLAAMELLMLEEMRKKGDMIATFMFPNSSSELKIEQFFKSRNARSTNGHSRKLSKSQVNSYVRRYIHSNKVVNT